MTDKQIITKSQMIMRIAELSANLEAKWQECEDLKKIIDEAKNSKLDLKSFLVGKAVQNEYEQQLDQLKAENEHLSEKEEEARHYLEEAEKFKNCISEIKSLCYEQDLNEDFFACEVLQKINEVENGSEKF